jgi:chemotaxis protein methyltransferase CheR
VTVSEAHWASLSALVASWLGLHFPPSRHVDLKRGLDKAASVLGFADGAEFIRALLAGPPTRIQLDVLADTLSIGETYFFRDQAALDALAGDVLEPVIAARRQQGHLWLRLWSAGCSSGEEAYTLAILLHRLLPDIGNWQISIAATDISPRALQRARDAHYGEWSFRGAPGWLRRRYFKPREDGRLAVIPEIRRMVRFAQHNLLAEPEFANGTASGQDLRNLDLILCRHVLMYFTTDEATAVIARLRRCLHDGGWLVTSPTEATHAMFPGFVALDRPGVILFKRQDVEALAPDANRPLPAPFIEYPIVYPFASMSGAAATPPPADATAPPIATTPADVAQTTPAGDTVQPGMAAMLAQTLANQGRLADALHWCDQWLAANKLAPAAHYLRAMVLIETGDTGTASISLRNALYLDPGFALAHVALGQLDLARGAHDDARRHFARAMQALAALDTDAALPGSDSMTAGALADTLRRLDARAAET